MLIAALVTNGCFIILEGDDFGGVEERAQEEQTEGVHLIIINESALLDFAGCDGRRRTLLPRSLGRHLHSLRGRSGNK